MAGPKSSVCGVQVATWGTDPGGSSGMLDYMESKFYGKNTGHASISVTFPANDQTKGWIAKYCIDPAIPYEKHLIQTKQALHTQEGEYGQTTGVAHEEEVYVVHFSWFPGNQGFYLCENINRDGLNERVGIHRDWNENIASNLDITPEQRIHRGALGTQTMTYGALEMTHLRNLNELERQLMGLQDEKLINDSACDNLRHLKDKLNDYAETTKSAQPNNKQIRAKLTDNDKLLLDKYYPQWQEDINFKKNQGLSLEQLKHLHGIIEQKFKVEKEHNMELTSKIEETERALATGVKKEYLNTLYELDQIRKELDEMAKYAMDNAVDDDFEAQFYQKEKYKEALKKKCKQLCQTEEVRPYLIKEIQMPVLDEIRKGLSEALEQNNHVNIEQLISLDASLVKHIDDIFSSLSSDFEMSDRRLSQVNPVNVYNWRAHFHCKEIELETKISAKDASELLGYIKDVINDKRAELLDIQKPIGTFEQFEFNHFRTSGETADGIVDLPINKQGQFDLGHEQGLDVESMLAEMHAIAQDKIFDLRQNNCSDTVLRILKAGTDNPHLKSKFENKAMGTIGNPQVVYNDACEFKEALNSPNDSLGKKIGRINPIKRAAGWCVDKCLVNKQASVGQKIVGWIAIGPVVLAAGAVGVVKSLANPLKAMNELNNFRKHTSTKKPGLLKAGATMLTYPAMALMAVPTAVHYGLRQSYRGIRRIGQGIANLFKVTTNQEQKQTAHVDMEGKDTSIGEAFESHLKSELEQNIKFIHANDFKTAMIELKKALAEGPAVLDEPTTIMVHRSLQRIRDPKIRQVVKSKYDTLCLESAEKIVNLQKTLLAQENMPHASSAVQDTLSQNTIELEYEQVAEPVIAQKEQFYAVMPLLGQELAKQIPEYASYVEPKANKNSSSDLPPGLDKAVLEKNEGCLINSSLKQAILELFKQDANLAEIPKGFKFPEGHPREGEPIPFDVFRDNHGDIFVVNDKVLGQGSFGTVKLIQALSVSPDNPNVVANGFYALKIQTIDKENTLGDIQKEMDMNARFGLHFGQAVLTHDVEVKPAEYDYVLHQNEVADAPNHDHTDQQRNELLPETSVNDNLDLAIDDDDFVFNTYSLVIQRSDSQELSDDKPGWLRDSHELATENPNFTNPDQKTTLDELAQSQPGPITVESIGDVNDFDLSHFVHLFDLMAAEVEHVHKQGVVHLDIKPENFLYDKRLDKMKLIDFGLAMKLSENLPSPNEYERGSPINMGPEFFHPDFNEPLSTKQDSFGLGRTMSVLMYRSMQALFPLAYEKRTPSPKVAQAIKEELTTNFLVNFRFGHKNDDPRYEAINDLISLIQEMQQVDVNQRPEMTQVRQKLQAIQQSYNHALDAVKKSQTPIIPGEQVIDVMKQLKNHIKQDIEDKHGKINFIDKPINGKHNTYIKIQMKDKKDIIQYKEALAKLGIRSDLRNHKDKNDAIDKYGLFIPKSKVLEALHQNPDLLNNIAMHYDQANMSILGEKANQDPLDLQARMALATKGLTELGSTDNYSNRSFQSDLVEKGKEEKNSSNFNIPVEPMPKITGQSFGAELDHEIIKTAVDMINDCHKTMGDLMKQTTGYSAIVKRESNIDSYRAAKHNLVSDLIEATRHLKNLTASGKLESEDICAYQDLLEKFKQDNDAINGKYESWLSKDAPFINLIDRMIDQTNTLVKEHKLTEESKQRTVTQPN